MKNIPGIMDIVQGHSTGNVPVIMLYKPVPAM